jgi:hypothetical protein
VSAIGGEALSQSHDGFLGRLMVSQIVLQQLELFMNNIKVAALLRYRCSLLKEK